MRNLIVAILYNFSVIGISAYMITRLPPIRRILLEHSIRWHDRCFLILIFGSLSILGNGLGIPVHGSLANSRIVGPIVGGLIGGPLVGIGAGIMGGVIRYQMGGFTMPAAVTANIIAGLIAGLVQMRYGSRNITLPVAGLTALVCEIILKSLVLAMSNPFEAAWVLERLIAPPTITANCLSTILFIYIFREMYKDQDNAYVNSAHQALQSIRRTNNLLQNGLNKDSAQIMADVIYQELKPDAVCITDNTTILAFRGVGSEHHTPGLLSTSLRALNQDNFIPSITLSSNPQDIGCPHPDCPLATKLSVPLTFNKKFLGSINLFKIKTKRFLPHEIELARGLADFTSAQLFANQIALQTRLLEQAEYNALKAQVNPHFLFNILATIRILILKDPHNARLLIKDLSELLRQALNQKQEFNSLREELDTIKRYLRLEKARFGDRISVHWDVPKELFSRLIPAFTLQPLIENAIKHGLSPRKEGGNIYIRIWTEDTFWYLCVEDDGVGLTPVRNPHQSLPKTGTGIGLTNITQRLRIMYANTASFTLLPRPAGGAQALVKLPVPVPAPEDAPQWKESEFS